MRGKKETEDQLFYSFSVENRIAKDHPLRAMKKYVDDILANRLLKIRCFSRALAEDEDDDDDHGEDGYKRCQFKNDVYTDVTLTKTNDFSITNIDIKLYGNKSSRIRLTLKRKN